MGGHVIEEKNRAHKHGGRIDWTYPLRYILARIKWIIQDPYYLLRYIRFIILIFTIVTLGLTILIAEDYLPASWEWIANVATVSIIVCCATGVFLYNNPYLKGFFAFCDGVIILIILAGFKVIEPLTVCTIVAIFSMCMIFFAHHIIVKMLYCVSSFLFGMATLVFAFQGVENGVTYTLIGIFALIFIILYLFVQVLRKDRGIVYLNIGPLPLNKIKLVPDKPRTVFIKPVKVKVVENHIHNTYTDKHYHQTINNYAANTTNNYEYDEQIHINNNSGSININGNQATDSGSINRSDVNPPSTKKGTKTCYVCGTECDSDAVFCKECGNKF